MQRTELVIIITYFGHKIQFQRSSSGKEHRIYKTNYIQFGTQTSILQFDKIHTALSNQLYLTRYETKKCKKIFKDFLKQKITTLYILNELPSGI
jgi:hypothetical protein